MPALIVILLLAMPLACGIVLQTFEPRTARTLARSLTLLAAGALLLVLTLASWPTNQSHRHFAFLYLWLAPIAFLYCLGVACCRLARRRTRSAGLDVVLAVCGVTLALFADADWRDVIDVSPAQQAQFLLYHARLLPALNTAALLALIVRAWSRESTAWSSDGAAA